MRHSVLLATGLILSIASQAQAGDYYEPQNVLTLHGGAFDVFAESNDPTDEIAMGGLEMKFVPFWKGLGPMAGAFATFDGSYYGYGGFHYTWQPHENWAIIPNIAVGLYEDGGGKDLGGAVEFRSGIEVDYVFENQHRFGLAFHHLSNASIYEENPGTETFTATYTIPLGSMAGWW